MKNSMRVAGRICGVAKACLSIGTIALVLSVMADGASWSYRLINGDEAELYKSGDIAVAPKPTGALSIPASLGGHAVASIGNSAFSACDGMTSVSIPDSVRSIGDYAFKKCYGLKEVSGMNNVTNIGAQAFTYCANLPKITLPDGLKSIGAYAFLGCSNLVEVVIPDSVVRIGARAFVNCVNLRTVSLPKTLEGKFDASVFDGCHEGLVITYRASPDDPTFYTVKYHKNDPNGGEDVTRSQDIVVGETKRLLYLDSALKWSIKDEDGFSYIFLGWAKSRTGAAVYANGEQVCDLVAAGKVMHLYAVWQKRAYDVVYHSNDGENLKETQEFRPGIAKTLLWLDSGLGWTRSGYNFLGWAKSPTGPVVYSNGQNVVDLVAMGEKLHLYAVWQKRAMYITFHSNDGRNLSATEEFKPGVAKNLYWLDSGLGWTRSDCNFLGWAKSPTGGVVYANGQTVSDFIELGKTLHLYAVWRVAD